MNILDLFKLPKDPTNEPHPVSKLYVGKLYSATRVGGTYDFDTPMQADLVSYHYVLLIKERGKYYVVPTKVGQKARLALDINDVKKQYELAVQPDTESRFKPFTYYAPSAEFDFVTPDQLRKLAKFIHHYFVKGDDHAHRKDLDVYFKFLKKQELNPEEEARLEDLKDFADKIQRETEELSK